MYGSVKHRVGKSTAVVSLETRKHEQMEPCSFMSKRSGVQDFFGSTSIAVILERVSHVDVMNLALIFEQIF